MKRVLLTVHKFFPAHRAGTEVLTLKVGQELQRRGYEVLVVTADPPDLDARRVEGADVSDYVYEGLQIKVFHEPLRTRGYEFEHEFDHPLMSAAFAQVLDEFKPDLVHTFHVQNLSAGIISVADERGVPVVCSATDFWFVCPIVQLKLPDGSLCRGPSAGAKNCLTCYTPKLFPPQEEFEEALVKRMPLIGAALKATPQPVRNLGMGALFAAYKTKKYSSAACATINRPAALRAAANKAKAIMVPTNLMRDIFVENGIRAELIHKVPFGIDTEPLLPFRSKVPSQTLRIGFVGTLFEHKGVDLLINAFQSLPADANAVLKIYGDPQQFPEYGAQLKALAARALPNSEKIEFCGTFPNSQFGSVMQNLDVLVVPSRWYENTPLVIQSALTTRTPLIVTDLGGMAEVIEEGRTGLLFKLNNFESLREQLAKLLADRELVRHMSNNIPDQRSVGDMVDDIESIYRSSVQPEVRDRIASLAG